MPEREPAALDVTCTVSPNESPVDLQRIVSLMSFIAGREGLSGELGIWLCTDDEMADMHLRFMNVPGPTDVITFPDDAAEPGPYLGDIAVSVDTAAEQASQAGHDTAREIAFLCLHGLLHIAGYDDLDERSRTKMLTRQEALLNEFERTFPGSWS